MNMSGKCTPLRGPHGVKNFPRQVQWTCLGKVKCLMRPRNHEIFFPDKFIEHCLGKVPALVQKWKRRKTPKDFSVKIQPQCGYFGGGEGRGGSAGTFPRHVQWTCLGKIFHGCEVSSSVLLFPDMFIEHVWENFWYHGGPQRGVHFPDMFIKFVDNLSPERKSVSLTVNPFYVYRLFHSISLGKKPDASSGYRRSRARRYHSSADAKTPNSQNLDWTQNNLKIWGKF